MNVCNLSLVKGLYVQYISYNYFSIPMSSIIFVLLKLKIFKLNLCHFPINYEFLKNLVKKKYNILDRKETKIQKNLLMNKYHKI